MVDEELENAEIVMKTLNGLPRSWDSFIQGICARKKLLSSVDYGNIVLKKNLR